MTGIVQGALLVGWRLTQIPKSQSLEFLLASPLRPARVFLAEALAGLGRLALVSATGIAVLLFLASLGYLEWLDVPVLIVMPYTWGAVTALGLTTWAYESIRVRTWIERIIGVGILFYLAVGVLIGEKLQSWLSWLPPEVGRMLRDAIVLFHHRNPFGVMRAWMLEVSEDNLANVIGLELIAVLAVVVLLLRSASRLHDHFQERHYRPFEDLSGVDRGDIGDRPLSWWAVRRVMEYSGRVNLWLAGGFGVLYAAYTVAGPAWPSWLGKIVFVLFDQMGGIPVLATALVVLAAVPAAFQYGLWDSNAQDRCRRLELLLLTQLDATDYWHAACSAAWRRGRGYFYVAVILWLAGTWAGQMQPDSAGAGILRRRHPLGALFRPGISCLFPRPPCQRARHVPDDGPAALPLCVHAIEMAGAGEPAAAGQRLPGSGEDVAALVDRGTAADGPGDAAAGANHSTALRGRATSLVRREPRQEGVAIERRLRLSARRRGSMTRGPANAKPQAAKC